MSFFIKQSQVEELLELETRTLTGPDGAAASFTAFKALWKAYDFLILLGVHTHEHIVELAVKNSELMGIPFEKSFSAVIWDANDQGRKLLGIDCFAVRPRP